jgi:hypothetical protein
MNTYCCIERGVNTHYSIDRGGLNTHYSIERGVNTHYSIEGG